MAEQLHRAAGVLLVSPAGRILLLRRRPGGEDHGGEWAFPGGGIEPGETAEQAAHRELTEETGIAHEGALRPWTRRIKDGVDFTTFTGRLEEFEPKLNEEHDLYKWLTLDEALAEPAGEVILHPGARVALKRLSMDEREVAEAIRDGELASPQRFGNFLLIALRVTGTGVAYRLALDEFVWRDPALYLNDHFLARCNGLEVIWEHPPERSMLDGGEFRRRMIGTSVLPYLKGDEVWTIARVRDEDAIPLLENETLSTSPGVVFLPGDGNLKVAFGDERLLIEGKPSILDHLAVCEMGVWDKTGPASGVDNSGAHVMPAEKESEARKDKVERDCSLDSISSMCDAYEEQMRKDGPFQKMVHKLSHRKGVTNPRALAAYIGRKSLGQKEMTRRSVAGRKS